MKLELNREELTSMLEHAEQEYPRECVGAIVGLPDDSSSHRLVRLTNKQDKLHKDDPEHFKRDARTGYFVDPKEVFDLVRDTEKEGLKILALYHSHPEHESYFSSEDHAAAVMFDEPVYPGAAYIVISVFDGKVKEAVIFSWDGKGYSPSEKLTI